MSKVGRQPIDVPESVTIALSGNSITIKGSKGELHWDFPDCISVVHNEKELVCSVSEETDDSKAKFGLTRALIANMVTGVSDGFEKKLQIIGVGYKAELQGKNLKLLLGFSHPVFVEAPEHISFSLDNDIITVSGIDKQVVGETSAKIRSFRPPEPYKGKGVRYVGEHVRRKVGKAAAGSAGA